MTTLAYYKTQKEVAEFYERWPADADYPSDLLLSQSVQGLESTGAKYDPDDAAPWEWNLDENIFSDDLGWNELLNRLCEA